MTEDFIPLTQTVDVAQPHQRKPTEDVALPSCSYALPSCSYIRALAVNRFGPKSRQYNMRFDNQQITNYFGYFKILAGT
jgi:hypothetical protein